MSAVKRATPAATAVKVRADLKTVFPGVKFSVRSATRGRLVVDVGWEDGPTTAAVWPVIGHYQHGHFDGMTDSYSYRPGPVINGVEYGVDYVSLERNMSDAARTRFMALIQQGRADLDGKQEWEIEELAWHEFLKWDGCTAELPETPDDLPSAREGAAA